MLASLFRIALALVALYLAGQAVIWAVSPSAEAQAQRLVEQVRQQGPKQITPDLRLVRAEFADRQLRLVFDMDADKARSANWVESFRLFRRKACTDVMTLDINAKFSLVYLIEADGVAVQRLVLPPSSCP